jgi:uncharacterized membrane protein YbhN (UPF0104 family)
VSVEPRPSVDPVDGRPEVPVTPARTSSLPDFPIERSFDDDTQGTLVIEDGVIPRRVRRPADVIRLSLALVGVAVVVAIAYFLSGTSTGIEQDVTQVSGRLPSLILVTLNLIGGLGLLALPIAAAIDLLVRRRGRQLVDAIGAMVVGIALAVLIAALVALWGTAKLLLALTGTDEPAKVFVLNPLIVGLVAFITVARLLGRGRWGVFAVITVVAVSVGPITNGSATVAVISMSLLLGWAVGLGARYALGTPTTRPSGMQVADVLERAGLPLTLLRADKHTARGRQYSAYTRSGSPLRVVVFDRDLEGAGVGAAAWRNLRLRTDPGSPGGFSLRAQLEPAALMTYAGTAAGAPVPALRLASEVGPDSTLLVYDQIPGTTWAEVGPGVLTDADLDAAFGAVHLLHRDRIAHRALSAEQIIRPREGVVWVAGLQHGTIASSDLAERIDLAEILTTAAVMTDPARAVAAGARVFGEEKILRALPALQVVALSSDTRRRVRKDKKLLGLLREELVALRPSAAETPPIELRRITPRTLLTIVAGTIAGYVLLSQLANVDLVGLVRQANLWWVLVALVLAFLTFVGASLSLSGFVPEKLSHVRTFAAQLAAAFATLVSPPTVGAVAVNVRYLQRSGLHPALAAASVGVSQVFAFFLHITMLFIVGILAGTNSSIELSPPAWAIWAVAGVVLALGLLLMFGPVRKILVDRVRPILKEVGPRLVTLTQQPWKIAEGMGGILLLNAAFAACMIACVEAFDDGPINYAAVALVYLAGSTLGQAAPTPGGLGAVEAAYVFGLTAAGVDSAVAVSATLLFRLLTFWLPTLPGYWSFNWLQRVGSL